MFVAASSECFPSCRWTVCCSGWSISNTPTSRSPSTKRAGRSSPRPCWRIWKAAIASLPRNLSADHLRLQRRHRGRRRSVLRAVCRLLPPGQGHESRGADGAGRRIGHPLQRRDRALAAAGGHRLARGRAGRRENRNRPHHPRPRHGRRVVRQRQGTGDHARSQPLHLRSARRRELRPGDEARLQRPPARHQQGQTASPRRPGPGRIWPADHAIGQGSATTGP